MPNREPITAQDISDLIVRHILSRPYDASTEVTEGLLAVRGVLGYFADVEDCAWLPESVARERFAEAVSREFSRHEYVPGSYHPMWPSSMPSHVLWPQSVLRRIAAALVTDELQSARERFVGQCLDGLQDGLAALQPKPDPFAIE